MAACADRLQAEGADLGAYNSVASANDVDAIRAALGHDQWNVLGISYGTRLGQEVVRNHPDGVRALVLDSVQPTDPKCVPEEACQILRDGTKEIVGRITSSRYSPTLERSVCLAQVTKEFAAAGTTLTVLLVNGERITAKVMEHHAHFDPEGERLRG